VLPGGTGTLAELAMAWEMMNKSSLSRTVGGRKPLLVMEGYWRPVIDCLKQEATLALPTADRPAAAMDLITLVSSVNQIAESLASDALSA
jgi:predicted Rossmann-fold nucleotide-binding protein